LQPRAHTVEAAEVGGSGGGSSWGEGEGASAVFAASPVVGVAGGRHLSLASLLSSHRLALLARSLLLLPEWRAWALVSVETGLPPPTADGRNQSVTSSVHPSVSNTSLAGIPALLQRTHARYWLCAHGGWRGGCGLPV